MRGTGVMQLPAELDRRGFLAGIFTAPWLLRPAAIAADVPLGPDKKTLDLHVHLFGVGDTNSGCRMSAKVTGGIPFKLLMLKLGIHRRAKTVDEGYVAALAQEVTESDVDQAVILAQDAAYDRDGKPDWERTQFYIPNDYLFSVVARWPERMVPCVGINPDRADAVDELERCASKGARVLKIHPPTQGVDIAQRKHERFFRRCTELKVLVMVHTGHEHAAPVVDIALASPRRLELALDQGCTVIACHCGTGRAGDMPDMLPEFLALIRRHPKLWGDTAVLGGLGRERDFARLLADEAARDRLLHGSDFPFPAFPLNFKATIGDEAANRTLAIGNQIKQDLALKECLGIGRKSAHRAFELLHRDT